MKNTGEKVDKWVNEVTKLTDFAISQPQASYAAFTFALRHRWTYLLRTLPDIAQLLEPLEPAINDVLMPAVTDHTVTKVERDFLGLPLRMDGLEFTDPLVTSSSEYEASIEVTNPLLRRIVEQEHQPPLRCLRNSNTAAAAHENKQVKNSLPTKAERAVELATGRTNWLTVIPLKELDYKLNKKEFRDAIKLRYDSEIVDTPMLCACGV